MTRNYLRFLATMTALAFLSVDIAFSQKVVYANPSTPGTTTCGVQEALNSLPATGGAVQANWVGTCTATTGIAITKPVDLSGLSTGGLDAVWSISAGAILANGSTTANLISVEPPSGSTFLQGVSIHDIALQGNRSVSGATAGDNLVLAGPSTSQNSYFSNININRVTSFGAYGNDLSIENNAYMIQVSQSQFLYARGHGISVTNPAGGQPSQLHFSQINSSLNSGDGIFVGSTTPADIHLYQSTVSSDLNGVYLSSSSSGSYLDAVGCNFEANANAGADLLSQGPNSIINSTFASDGTQHYGIYEDPGSGANWVGNVLTLMGNMLQTNLTADLYLSSNVHLAAIYQEQTSKFASQTTFVDNSAGGARWYTTDAGFTGTKSIGSCTLVITGGFVTNVTGC